MKKNLLSILILALLIVNIALNAVIMISVTSTNKKTAAVIGDIASILNIEVENAKDDAAEKPAVSIADTVMYNIEDQMTIPLKAGDDGQQHFALVSVSLAMNSTHDDYKTYGETISDKESLIKGEIREVVSSYTIDQIPRDVDLMTADILKRVQTMFDSDFIYKITFRDIIPQ